MAVRDLTPAFNKKYQLNKTRDQIISALKNHGIICGRKYGERLYTARLYSPKEIKFLKRNYAGRNVAELSEVFNRRFNRNMTQRQIRTFVNNRHVACGRTGRFEKGHKSWNLGTKGLTGANRTSFRKGQICNNLKPLGTERLSKDGFIEVKVAERNPYTGHPTRFKFKHVYIYEQLHGPVPYGFCVAFIDGDRLNLAPENLMLVTRSELLQLNRRHYKDTPGDLKPSVLAVSKLVVQIGRLSNES